LKLHLSSWIPWLLTEDDFYNRKGIDPAHITRDVDIFTYVQEKSPVPGEHIPLVSEGCKQVRFIPQEGAVLPEHYTFIGTPDNKELSPQKRTEGYKYFVGEAYAGNKAEMYIKKLKQIDEILGIIKTRWELREKNRGTVVQIAHLVGLSALVLFSGKDSASGKANHVFNLIVAHLASTMEAYPHLRSMIKESRFCVIAIHSDDCPETSGQQLLSKVLGGMLQTQKELVESNKELMHTNQLLMRGMETLLKVPLESIKEHR
jgi:hypothetical protein